MGLRARKYVVQYYMRLKLWLLFAIFRSPVSLKGLQNLILHFQDEGSQLRRILKSYDETEEVIRMATDSIKESEQLLNNADYLYDPRHPLETRFFLNLFKSHRLLFNTKSQLLEAENVISAEDEYLIKELLDQEKGDIKYSSRSLLGIYDKKIKDSNIPFEIEAMSGLSDAQRRVSVLVEKEDLIHSEWITLLSFNYNVVTQNHDLEARKGLLRNRIITYLFYYSFVTAVAVLFIISSTLFVPLIQGSIFGTESDINEPRFLIYIIAFGVMGAGVSGLISFSRHLMASRRASWEESNIALLILPVVIVAKLVLASGAALAVFAFLQSGLLQGIVQIEALTPGLILALAFASGFSERLLLRALKPFIGDDLQNN